MRKFVTSMTQVQSLPKTAVLLIGAIVCGYYSFNLLMLIIAFTMFNSIFYDYLSRPTFNSSLLRGLVASFVSFIVLQCIILACWLFNPNIPLSATPAFMAIISIFSVIWYKISRRTNRSAEINKRLRVITREDVVALTIAVITCLIMLLGPIKSLATGGMSLDAFFVHCIDMSIDDSNHLGRINDRLQLDRGVLYRTDKVEYVSLNESISSYPAGWHSANAVVIKAMYPSLSVGRASLVTYVILKIVWMMLLIYLFTRFVILLVKKVKDISTVTTIWIGGATLFFSIYMLIEQFYQGFFSFIPELICILIGAMVIVQHAESHTITKDKSYETLSLMIVLTAGATLSWVLTLPGFAIAIIVLYLLPGSTKNNPLLGFTRSIRTLSSTMPIVLLATVAVLLQVYLINTTSYRSFAQGINDPGGIYIHSQWYVMFAIVGTILLVSLGRFSRLLANMFVFLAGLLSFSAFIYLFQMATISKIEYYTYKILVTVFILAIPLAIAGFATLISRVDKLHGNNIGITLSIILVLLLPMTIGINPTNASIINNILGRRSVSNELAEYAVRDIEKQSTLPYQERTTNTIMFNNDPGGSVIMTNMLRTTKHVDTCNDRLFSAVLRHNIREVLETQAHACTSSLRIITDTETAPSLQNEVRQYGSSSVELLIAH